MQQPGQRDLHRRQLQPCRDIGQGLRLQRREAAEREERHIGDALLAECVDQAIVVAVHQVVVVLHADYRRDALRLGNLPGGDVADAEMANQTLLLQLGQCTELWLDGAFGRRVHGAHGAQVDHIEHIQSQVAQVVVHRPLQFGRALRGVP